MRIPFGIICKKINKSGKILCFSLYFGKNINFSLKNLVKNNVDINDKKMI